MSEPSWLDRYFFSAFVINDAGVAELSVTETTTTGDDYLEIPGKYGHALTPDDAELDVALPWTIEANEVRSLEIYITAKSADAAIRRLIKVSAIVWGDGATATLDQAPTVVEAGTGNATATLTVSGSTMSLALDPVDATPLTWGYEVRSQKL